MQFTPDLSVSNAHEGRCHPACLLQQRRDTSTMGPGGREEDDKKTTFLGHTALVIADELL